MPYNYYDEIAPGYDDLHKEEQLQKLFTMLDILNVTKDDRLLDVGCGTAFSFDAYDAIGCRYQGAEPSGGLIQHSRYAQKITKCSAEKLPFPPNLFTIVVSVTALQNFDDPRKGLEEMARVCSDRLGISFLKRSSRADELRELIEELFEVWNVVEEERDLLFFCRVQKPK